MKASWFESKDTITLWTHPEYRGADIPDSFVQRSATKNIPINQLFGFEPDDKMKAKEHGDQLLQIALKMKQGTWDGDPIIVTSTAQGYMILDGHHRYAAARKAGIESLAAVVVDRAEILYKDDIPKGLKEASGYIPTKAQAKDPRFSSALTVDVKPGETQRQAAKLGMKIDKNGSPPLLHATAAKNTSANKAYNLGLTESLWAQYNAIKEETVTEANALSQWKNDEPVNYVKHLTKFFGKPDELTYKRAVWYNKDGFKRIVVLDEFILHTSPAPHYDFIYCYIDLEVPESLSDELAECSGSILIDHLKNEVGARCGSLTANATTLNFVIDVVAGRVQPDKEEYEARILGMKKQFKDGERYELDWWPDSTNDASPENEYYAETVTEALDNPFPYNLISKDNGTWVASAKTTDGRLLEVVFKRYDSGYTIAFKVEGAIDKTGGGDEFQIFATVKAVIIDWLSKVDLNSIDHLYFSADKDDDGPSRGKLYTRFAQQLANKLGWQLDVDDYGLGVSFKLLNPDLVDEGINEGYKMQIERGTDMMVLHITDTKTGKRTEVRGKAGYETNGYDPDDKLHQLLDKISKSANISELMNGEVVGINPKHPAGASAKTATTTAFNEQVNIDNKDGRGVVPHNKDVDYFGMRVKMKPSTFINLASKLGRDPDPEMVDYIRDGGGIGSPFLTIRIEDGEPATVLNHEGRNRMLAIAKAFGDIPVEVHLFFNGNSVNRARHLTPEIISYIKNELISQDDNLISGPLWENFADGKNPGRKGLSQRVGIPKNATIAQLEKAAKADGEKGRMARWQLNMRRGKGKKK